MAGKLSKQVGVAKIIDEAAYSDGSTAQKILNFRRNERGNLENKFLVMPMVHRDLCGAARDVPLPFLDGGCLAMAYTAVYGEVPEILFLTKTGVFRYAPWQGTLPTGLEEVFDWTFDDHVSVTPQGRGYFPPQTVAIGNRIYFTWGDGGGAWVWDVENERLRPFGYTARPSAPDAQGPAASEDMGGENAGGLSFRGRIGTTDGTFSNVDGEIVGGLDDGEWHYYDCFENEDGAYSAMSARGGMCSVRRQLADPDNVLYPEDLCRRWLVSGIPQAPRGTAATILLRTRNLKRLPSGDDGSPRFLHRIPSSIVDKWIDDIPDGELGPLWQDREVTPTGLYLMRSFGGSLWLGRTDGAPCRVWWSEQTNTNGPTPESVLAGHWRDVFPSTGPLTAFFEAQVGGGATSTAMLMLKETAAHFVTGQYPDWQFGTLHQRAGCAGPTVIAAAPDGTVIWYGARTFWRLNRDGGVDDIGAPKIQKRLRRVNYAEARNGSVFVDRHSGEVIFSLPMDDSITPDHQFVWDYIAQGWRDGNWMAITATLEVPNEDLIFVVGLYDEESNVFVWDRGAWNFETANDNKYNGLEDAVYQSGWTTFDSLPQHTFCNFEYAVGVGDEIYDGALTLRMLRNWNATETPGHDVSSPNGTGFTLAHPEQGSIAFWSSSVAGDRTPRPASFGALYRERRPYTVQLGVAAASAEVVGVELTVDPDTSFALVGLSVYGSVVDRDGARVGRLSEGQ